MVRIAQQFSPIPTNTGLSTADYSYMKGTPFRNHAPLNVTSFIRTIDEIPVRFDGRSR